MGKSFRITGGSAGHPNLFGVVGSIPLFDLSTASFCRLDECPVEGRSKHERLTHKYSLGPR